MLRKRLNVIVYFACIIMKICFVQAGGLDPIYITTVPYFIVTPGSYALGNVLQGGSAVLISIQTNDVVLDLNGLSLQQNSASGTCISIAPGSKNIVIRNGYIIGNGGMGIVAQASALLPIYGLTVSDLWMSYCSQSAIAFEYVQNSHIINNNFGTNGTALLFNSVINTVIDNCNFYQSNNAACLFNNCSNNNIRNCTMLGAESSDLFVYGIYSRNGRGNSIDQCRIESLSTEQTGSTFLAGIAFNGEFSSNILNCSVGNITGNNSYGIFAPGYYRESYDVEQTTSLVSVAWSPQGDYLAVCGTQVVKNVRSGFLCIYSVVDNKLTKIATLPPTGSALTTVAWAPQQDSNKPIFAIGGQDVNGDRLVEVCGLINGQIVVLAQVFNDNIASCTMQDETNKVWGVSWSQDNRHIAVAESDVQQQNGYVEMYEFDPDSLELAFVTFYKNYSCFASVAWKPNDVYLGVAGCMGSGSSRQEIIAILEFDSTNSLLTNVAHDINGTKPSVGRSVSWSPDAQYIALGGTKFALNAENIIIYKFLPLGASSSLIMVVSDTTDHSNPYATYCVSWSPMLQYIGVGSMYNNIGRTALYEFSPTMSQIARLIVFTDSISSSSMSRLIPAVAWNSDMILAQVSQDFTNTSNPVSHTSLYSFNLACMLENNCVMNIAGTGIEGYSVPNTQSNTMYAANLIMSNLSVQSNVSYGANVYDTTNSATALTSLANYIYNKDVL